MNYSNEKIMAAFSLYAELSRDGKVSHEGASMFSADDTIRGLVQSFANHVDAEVIQAGDQLHFVPLTKISPFHLNNESIKRYYLKSGATNADIYLLYFASIVLFGAFYDSYQTTNPTRDFLPVDEWARIVSEKIDVLKSHEEEDLRKMEKEFSYNWLQIMEKWDDMNDIKETAKRQSGNTISRLSFMDTAKRFLLDQKLIHEIGNEELVLTERAKTIVQRFFMDVQYNRGILAFLYEWKEDEEDAINQ